MSEGLDPSRLEDAEAAEAADPGGMLRQVASSAAQVREAQRAAAEAGVGALAEDGRPRAVVAVGMGAAAVAGDVLAAVCGAGCAVPVFTVRGYRLPGWVGAADLVIAVSSSGGTEKTLEVAVEAARRGCGSCSWARTGRRSPTWPPGAAACSSLCGRAGSRVRCCGP